MRAQGHAAEPPLEQMAAGLGGAHRESTPLLGCHLSEGRVNTMIGLAVSANLAAMFLLKRPRRIWYAAVTLIEG